MAITPEEWHHLEPPEREPGTWWNIATPAEYGHMRAIWDKRGGAKLLGEFSEWTGTVDAYETFHYRVRGPEHA